MLCLSSKTPSVTMNAFTVLVQLIIFSAVVTAVPVETTGKNEDTLVLLHVLFRHGNRTPDRMSLFPNDPHINETYEPFGYSQLTTKGKKTEYRIGKYLRSTYDGFIPRQYKPEVVSSISTNWKRTKMSLELVLASLFPPLKNEQIETNINWQPVPFNIELGQGIIGVASLYCANYLSEYYKYVLSSDAVPIVNEYKQLYNELKEYTGAPVKLPKDVLGVYVTLVSEEDFGLELPDWTAEIPLSVMEEAASVDYEFSTANARLKRLSSGFLLKKILDDTQAKISGTLPADRKIFLYSAHEYNVATMLRILNVFYRHVPPFGATIFFEIHKINGVYGLKLFYQDYTKLQPKLLTIPGCSSFCKLDRLRELVADSLPGQYDVCEYTDELL